MLSIRNLAGFGAQLSQDVGDLAEKIQQQPATEPGASPCWKDVLVSPAKLLQLRGRRYLTARGGRKLRFPSAVLPRRSQERAREEGTLSTDRAASSREKGENLHGCSAEGQIPARHRLLLIHMEKGRI